MVHSPSVVLTRPVPEVDSVKKSSHKLLASALLEQEHGFSARRYELAFLFGSFQPDCNPLTYLKGSLRSNKFCGHNFSNSQQFVNDHIAKLRQQRHWNVWQYYTLGKLTHYLADAFTFPHNETFHNGIRNHRAYEARLRGYLEEHLVCREVHPDLAGENLPETLDALHRRYLESGSNLSRDVRYILEAVNLLMASCLPKGAA